MPNLRNTPGLVRPTPSLHLAREDAHGWQPDSLGEAWDPSIGACAPAHCVMAPRVSGQPARAGVEASEVPEKRASVKSWTVCRWGHSSRLCGPCFVVGGDELIRESSRRAGLGLAGVTIRPGVLRQPWVSPSALNNYLQRPLPVSEMSWLK